MRDYYSIITISIFIFMGVAMAVAVDARDLAAIYVAVVGAATLLLLRSIRDRLDMLLDRQRIRVNGVTSDR